MKLKNFLFYKESFEFGWKIFMITR